MAADTDNLEIGDAVYEPYNPQNYGKVIDKQTRRMNDLMQNEPWYLIRWKNGSEEWRWSLDVKSLDALVAEHEKRAANHRKRMEKAKAL